MDSTYSSDINEYYAECWLVYKRIEKNGCFIHWSQQSKLVQKEALIEKCAKPVKYIDEKEMDYNVRLNSLAAKTSEAK